MSTATNIKKTSDIVQQELNKLGYSKLFNWIDYQYFKKQSIGAFNEVEAIVNLFIYYSCDESDFSEYVF